MAKKQKTNKTQVQGQETAIMRWLKRIFSLQTVSVIAAIIAAYYTYKAYVANEPSQVSIVNSSLLKQVNVVNQRNFIYLMSPNYRLLPIALGTPIIMNQTNNSIKDFRLEIDIFHPDLKFDDDEINKDYETIEKDSSIHTLKLRYKHNVLNAQSTIPCPIRSMYLPKDIPFSNDSVFNVFMNYSLTYDGIKGNCNFSVRYTAFFDNEKHLSITKAHMDKFLNECFEEGMFTKYKDNYLITIVDAGRAKQVEPTGQMTKNEFGKFKSDIIDNRNNW